MVQISYLVPYSNSDPQSDSNGSLNASSKSNSDSISISGPELDSDPDPDSVLILILKDADHWNYSNSYLIHVGFDAADEERMRGTESRHEGMKRVLKHKQHNLH